MEFLVRSEDLPGEMGAYPGSRPVKELLRNGLVLLDKWVGPTSRDVASTVKKVLCVGKAGHTGTLDPAVSGVLPVMLDNACKAMPALQGLDKEYVGIMRLHRDVGDAELQEAVKKFTGKIVQKPPVRSAVARKERERTVYSFDILERDGRNVLFRIDCQAGTYVRMVCHQIGQMIGGANMVELRRTRVGKFSENDIVRMQDVADAYAEWRERGSEDIRNFVLPVEACVEHLGKIIIRDSAVFSVASGTPLYSTGVSKVSSDVVAGNLAAILTLKGELVALARAAMCAEDIVKKKGLAAKIDRVVIDRELYKMALWG